MGEFEKHKTVLNDGIWNTHVYKVERNFGYTSVNWRGISRGRP